MFLSSDFFEKDLSGILSECQTKPFAKIISNIIDSFRERVYMFWKSCGQNPGACSIWLRE